MTEQDPFDMETRRYNATLERKMNETIEENPAVSKLREAFDTARNAIIEGSALAVQVQELQGIVNTLRSETTSLQRDLEYIRNRNRELDEQVTEVRRQRDNAISEGLVHKDRADTTERLLTDKEQELERIKYDNVGLFEQSRRLQKSCDDAMVMALEYETKWKAADAQLNKLKVLFGEAFGEPKNEEAPKPVPHYEVQPRDEVGKFQEMPKTYDAGSQGSF